MGGLVSWCVGVWMNECVGGGGLVSGCVSL